jgi:hypothetical protein
MGVVLVGPWLASAGPSTVPLTSSITLAQLISSAVGIVLPILVAVVTNRVASGAVKAVVLLVLAAISSFLSEWLVALNTAATFDLAQAAYGVLMTFVVAVATHFGLWKPAVVTGEHGAAARIGPDSTRHAA